MLSVTSATAIAIGLALVIASLIQWNKLTDRERRRILIIDASAKTVSAPFFGMVLIAGVALIGFGLYESSLWVVLEDRIKAVDKRVEDVQKELSDTQAKLLSQETNLSIEVLLHESIELDEYDCYVLVGSDRVPVVCLTDSNSTTGSTRKVKINVYDVAPTSKLTVLLEHKTQGGETLRSNEILIRPLSVEQQLDGSETPKSAAGLGPAR